METKTIYVPANRIGMYILNYLFERVGCSFGELRRVGNTIAAPITLPKRDVYKLEKILTLYDLM